MTPEGDHFKNCFLLAAVQVAQHRPEIFWLFINMSTCTVNWNMHFKILSKNGLFTVPEFTSLPSAGGFAERFFSGAQQRRLCREPNKKHSAKPLHSAKKALPSVR
jgi:hypothetical protein